LKYYDELVQYGFDPNNICTDANNQGISIGEICTNQNFSCSDLLNISGYILSGTYEADDIIICSGQINQNSNGSVTLLAGSKNNGLEYIELVNGFYASNLYNLSCINIECNPLD